MEFLGRQKKKGEASMKHLVKTAILGSHTCTCKLRTSGANENDRSWANFPRPELRIRFGTPHARVAGGDECQSSQKLCLRLSALEL